MPLTGTLYNVRYQPAIYRRFASLDQPGPRAAVLEVLTLAAACQASLNRPQRLERAAALGASLSAFDLIALQGLPSLDSEILTTISQYTQPHQYRSVTKGLLGAATGLTLLSAYPILLKDTLVFTRQARPGLLFRQGVAFTRLELPRLGRLDVFNAQLQGSLPRWAPRQDLATLRQAQLQELVAFLREHTSDEPVMLLGHFPLAEESPEYAGLVGSLSLADAFRGFAPFSLRVGPGTQGIYAFFRPGRQSALHVQDCRLVPMVENLAQPCWGLRTRFALRHD